MELKLHKTKDNDTRRHYLHFIDYRFYSFFWSEFYFLYKLFISYADSFLSWCTCYGPLKLIDLSFELGVLLKAAITLAMVRFTDTCASTLL